MECKLLIKTKLLRNKVFLAFKLSDVVFIVIINVNMPTIANSTSRYLDDLLNIDDHFLHKW